MISFKYKNIFKTLGPGLLFSSTAIGVSHLVQSTRAGADYGFQLIIFVILVNIFKYPFFEFGSRYANATGENLLYGYKKQGRWVLFLYFTVTFLSMFIVVAAISFVCSGIIIHIFDIQLNIELVSLLLFILCVIILMSGRYAIIDGLVKVLSVILFLSTILAFIFALIHGPMERIDNFQAPIIWDKSGIFFLIALMGWMPTAVDMSTWNSIWTIERIKQTNYKPELKETLLDFNIGYILTVILSICFITLGAYFMYGTGENLPDNSSQFAAKLIRLYTVSLGTWSYWLIAISAFSVMFSTALAVFDGYSRSIETTFELLFDIRHSYIIYFIWLIIIASGSYMIIWLFLDHFKLLIDIATSISFLIAPFFGVINYKVINSENVPLSARPHRYLNALAILGIVFLFSFAILFLCCNWIF